MKNTYILNIRLGARGGARLEDCKSEAKEMAITQGQNVFLKHNGHTYEFHGKGLLKQRVAVV